MIEMGLNMESFAKPKVDKPKPKIRGSVYKKNLPVPEPKRPPIKPK